MKSRKEKLVEKTIKEAIGGDTANVSTSVNMITYKDNPLVQELVKILNKEFKKEDATTLQFIHENGDIWEFGIRFEIEEPSQQMQFTREIAKSKAYEIKRKLEEVLMPKFNIPSFSIQGVRTVKTKDNKFYCEFAISLIYANKGNLKVTYESYNRLVESVIEAELTEDDKDQEVSHTALEKSMKEWEVLSQQIKKHEEDFKAMIEEKLKTETALKEKIFTVMEALDVKTKKVDQIVAKIKAGGLRTVGPTPTEKVAILMSKLNESTKKVVEKEFALLSKQVPFSAHKSIAVEEGVTDTIKTGYEFIKSKLSPWFTSLKDMFSLTNELETEINKLV